MKKGFYSSLKEETAIYCVKKRGTKIAIRPLKEFSIKRQWLGYPTNQEFSWYS
jgi:hypothetical protein